MRVPGDGRSTTQSGQFRSSTNRRSQGRVDDFGRPDREASRSRRQMSLAAGDVTRKQSALVRFEHVEGRARPRVDLYEPNRVGRNQKISAVEANEIQFRRDQGDGACDFSRLRRVGVNGSGSAAISKRRRGCWRSPLQAEADDFRLFPIRDKQRRDALSGDATLKITIRQSAARAGGRGDMGAAGAAAPLHQPKLRFVWRRKRN